MSASRVVATSVRYLLVALLLCVGWTSKAAALGLFVALPSSQADAAAQQATPAVAVIRQRDVALDTTYLTDRIIPFGIDNTDGRLAAVPQPTPVQIELFPGFVVNLNRRSLAEAYGGGFVWTGESWPGSGDTANLVIRSGLITGVVSFAGRTYRIDPLGVGYAHRISELDGSAFPGDIQLPLKLPVPKADVDTPQAATEITLLIAYTARVRNAVADVVAQANLAVSLANSGFSRSNIRIEYRLLGTILVNGYDEQAATSYEAPLIDLTNGTVSGPFQPVHAQRDALGADLVVLLFDRPDICGVAWVGGGASSAMSTVSYNCISNQSFAHETGHNMGLNHDRYVSGPAPSSQYNFGFVSIPGQFRDIMAYRDQCTVQNVICPRINNFSNPSVLYNGRATGIPQGTAGAADASRWLNEVRTTIAAYRQTVAPPADPKLVAAVAPVVRTTQVGNTTIAFATIINAGNATGTSCSIAKPAGAFNFTYRTNNNGTLGTLNTPVNIPGSNGRQDFLMTFQPTAAMSANLALVFDCTNSNPATSVVGLNTFLLTGTTTPVADVISTGATGTDDGILNVPQGGSNAAAYAAINIGATATLQARISASGIGAPAATLPGSMFICQTNAQAQCLATPAATVNFNSTTNSTATFTAFFNSNGTAIPFDPANKRLFVNFFQGTTPVGSASVAIRTSAPDAAAVTSASAN